MRWFCRERGCMASGWHRLPLAALALWAEHWRIKHRDTS